MPLIGSHYISDYIKNYADSSKVSPQLKRFRIAASNDALAEVCNLLAVQDCFHHQVDDMTSASKAMPRVDGSNYWVYLLSLLEVDLT